MEAFGVGVILPFHRAANLAQPWLLFGVVLVLVIAGTAAGSLVLKRRRGVGKGPAGLSEMYRAMMENARDAIALVDSDRRIVECNPAFLELFGYAFAEIEGRRADMFYASDEAFLEMGDRLNKEEGVVQVLDLVRKSGEVFPAEVSAARVREEDERVVGTIAVIRDVSDRMAAERDRRESQRRYRTLYEAAPIGIFRSHSAGRILEMNQSMAEILGYSSPESAIEAVNDLAHQVYSDPDDRVRFLSELEEHGSTEGFEFEIHTPDGERRLVQMSARVAESVDDGSFVIEGFIRDISARARAEEQRESLEVQLAQLQKLESIGRLAGGVAHDFNNMLSVIQGHAQLLMEKIQGDPELRENLDAVLHATNQSARLTKQLLAFARQQPAKPEDLDLNQSITSQLKMLRRLIREDISLIWEPGEDAGIVHIDSGQLNQILTNLLVNARDAIHGSGSIQIRTGPFVVDEIYASAHRDATAGDYSRLEVSDTGQGMDRETLEQIFEPFFTTKEEGRGTGLGLSTVYGIVRQNEGFVHAYSEVGQGTRLCVYLPRLEERDESEVASETAGSRTLEGDETILVVEDEPSVLELVEEILSSYGYRVLVARDPEEAIERVRAGADSIDLVLSDVVLPAMDGPELIERIRAFDPGLSAILMSGYAYGRIPERDLVPSDLSFIQKPFTSVELASMVRTTLDG